MLADPEVDKMTATLEVSRRVIHSLSILEREFDWDRVLGFGETRYVRDIRVPGGLSPLRKGGMVVRNELEFTPRDSGFS